MASLSVHFLFASGNWGVSSRWRKWRDIILPLCDRVIHYGDNNRMTVQNVAIVFGPTLLRPETESANITMFMVFQNQIVEFILNEYERIFHWGRMCSSHPHWPLHATCTGPFCARNTWGSTQRRKEINESTEGLCWEYVKCVYHWRLALLSLAVFVGWKPLNRGGLFGSLCSSRSSWLRWMKGCTRCSFSQRI